MKYEGIGVLLVVVATVLGNAALAVAQAPVARPPKVLTPAQKTFQAEVTQWNTQQAALHAKAQAAFDVEMEREKRGDCPDVDSTRATEECLSAEIDKTRANYNTFAGAIRAM